MLWEWDWGNWRVQKFNFGQRLQVGTYILCKHHWEQLKSGLHVVQRITGEKWSMDIFYYLTWTGDEYGRNESYGLFRRCEDNLTQESYWNLFITTLSDCTRTVNHSTWDPPSIWYRFGLTWTYRWIASCVRRCTLLFRRPITCLIWPTLIVRIPPLHSRSGNEASRLSLKGNVAANWKKTRNVSPRWRPITLTWT